MSYQVIARKWRPQTFDEVTGQEPITRTLRGAIEHERLHHAYLFSGARGVGKTTTARLLAKALNCHRADRPTPTPCAITDPEACPSCREIAEGRSIDVLEIDAASNTGVENVRETIVNTVAIRPARDRYKVFIIDEVHMLSGAAFNALLKTLEEPPSRVVFIMATTESHKLPDTILSRCQQFEFRTIPAAKIVERLRLIAGAEKVNVSDEALREIARAGEGSMRDAQSAFDQVISFSGESIGVEDVETALGLASAELRARVMNAVAGGAPAEALKVVDSLVMRGHDLRNFCRDMLAHVRDLLIAKVAGEATGLADVSDTERQEMRRAADAFSESDLVRFFHSLTETEKALRESVHPRYQLEVGLVKLIEMRRLASVSLLIERIAALEESLRTGKAPAVAGGGGPAPPAAVGGGGRDAARRSSNSSQTGGNSSTTVSSAQDASAKPVTNHATIPPEDVPFPVSDATPTSAFAAKAAAPVETKTYPSTATAPQSSTQPSPAPGLKLVPSSPATTGAKAKDPSSFTPVAAPSFFDEPMREDHVGQRVPASAAFADSPSFPGDVAAPARGVEALAGSDVERIKVALEDRRKPFLVVALEGAREVRIEGDELYVEFAPEGKHLRDSLAKPDNMKILREACRASTGRDLGVQIVIKAAGEGADGTHTEQDEARLEKQRLREIAEQDPTVQMIIKTFRAEIVDVTRIEGEAQAAGHTLSPVAPRSDI